MIGDLLPAAGAGVSRAGHELVFGLLDELVPREHVDLRLTIASTVHDLLRLRTSPLRDRAVWDGLGLFARDEAVLEPSAGPL
jgi:hypothetical protein